MSNNRLLQDLLQVYKYSGNETKNRYGGFMKRRNFIKSAIAAGITLVCGSIPTSIAGTKKMIDINSTPISVVIGDIEGLIPDIHQGDFIIIGSRPVFSKIDISYRLIRHFVDMKKTAAFFSYEISKENISLHIMLRELYAEYKDSLLGTGSGDFWSIEVIKLLNVAKIVSDYPIYLDDTPTTTRELCNKITALNSKHQDLGIIIIDCLQFLKANGSSEDMEQDMIQASKSLKQLAKELNVPIVAFNYIRRNVELEADKRPVLADLGFKGRVNGGYRISL